MKVHQTRCFRARSFSARPVTLKRHIGVAASELKDTLFRLHSLAGCEVLRVISRGAEHEVVVQFADEKSAAQAMRHK